MNPSMKRSSGGDNSKTSVKRLKTTGDEDAFQLVALTHFGDKVQTNDEVHQSIELCPVMKALVDTEVFQRLRNIKQLGTSEYLYDCANGNRFQHSLGVAKLAERMAKTIQEEQPNLGTTHKDVLCVKLAGLLHDIGHGPYSHVYEAFRENDLVKYLKRHPELKGHYSDCEHLVVPKKWSHEQSSLLMIDTVLAELGLEIDLDNLDQPLRQIGDGVDAKTMRVFKPPDARDAVLTSRDFVFIKECILGEPLGNSTRFIGREEDHKEFLYDIVNNKWSGLDVDKLDYFARDATRTGVESGSIDYKLIDDARVSRVRCVDPSDCWRCEGAVGMHYTICYPKKHVSAAMQFFKKRLYLHTIVYQHKKTVAAESILRDILCLADPFLRLKSYGGESFPISRAVLKSEFLVRLDDNIFTLIDHSTQPELADARALCRRFKRHNFYKCAVDQSLNIESGDAEYDIFTEDDEKEIIINSRRDSIVYNMDESEIEAGILGVKNSFVSLHNDADDSCSLEGCLVVKKYCMHHGRKSENPLLCMRFFDSMNEKIVGPLEDLPKAIAPNKHEYNSVIPSSLQKTGVRIFCRDPSKRDVANQFFYQWFESIREEAASGGPAPATAPTPRLQMEDAESDDSGDDSDAYNGNGGHCIPLSQESFDDDEHLGRARQDDQSPVPVFRKRPR